MTKKDFVMIASVLRDVRTEAIGTFGLVAADMMIERVATEFEARNDRFDRARFLRACGL